MYYEYKSTALKAIMNKVRKNVQLSAELAKWVQDYARQVGASESSIIAIAVKKMKDGEEK